MIKYAVKYVSLKELFLGTSSFFKVTMAITSICVPVNTQLKSVYGSKFFINIKTCSSLGTQASIRKLEKIMQIYVVKSLGLPH